MISYQRYLEAIAFLGLHPGATIDDARKAYKVAMGQCHPDRFPGDEAKLEQSKATNNAIDDLEAMSKQGLLSRYATQAEFDKRTGGTAGGGNNDFLMDIFVIGAPAGFGKTYNWAKSFRPHRARARGITLKKDDRLNNHTIIASPTVDLIDQTYEMLVENKITYATKIHSKNTKGGVHQNVMKYHKEMAPDDDAILLISHAEILHHPMPPKPEDWDLVFDEMPECVSFFNLDAPFSHRHITRYVNAIPTMRPGLYQLVPKDEKSLSRLIRMAGNRNPFDGALEYFKPMAAAIVSGHTLLVPTVQYDDLIADEFSSTWAGHCDIMMIVPPTWFRSYRSVTMMGARPHSHFTALVWKRLWNVNFNDDDRFKLQKRHGVAQSRLLTIHYIFEERVSRGFLAKKTPKGETLFTAACQAVATFYKGEDFLWSAPRPGDDKDYGIEDRFWKKRGAFKPALRLPGKTHGLNHPEFMETHNVALMSVVQFSPNQFTLLHSLGLTDDEINKAMSFDTAYQDMMRCSLRQDRDSLTRVISQRGKTHAVHVTVMDKATASDIALEFTECQIQAYQIGRASCRE